MYKHPVYGIGTIMFLQNKIPFVEHLLTLTWLSEILTFSVTVLAVMWFFLFSLLSNLLVLAAPYQLISHLPARKLGRYCPYSHYTFSVL